MKHTKNKLNPYSKIINFSLEQDLYKFLCLIRNWTLRNKLKKHKKYYYYFEWKNHIENDILALFSTQRELDEFIRYCKLRYNMAKLFDNTLLNCIGIFLTIVFTVLVPILIEVDLKLILVFYSMVMIVFIIFYAYCTVFKEMKSMQIYKNFFYDVIEIAENFKIDKASSDKSPISEKNTEL